MSNRFSQIVCFTPAKSAICEKIYLKFSLFPKFSNYKSYVSKTKLAILHRNEMMLEDRPVLRQKAYVNRATKRQNFRNVRKTPKKLWKREIVEKVLELRRDGRAIVVNAAEFEEDDSENEEPTDNRNARETDENDSDDDEELYL